MEFTCTGHFLGTQQGQKICRHFQTIINRFMNLDILSHRVYEVVQALQ